MNVVGRHIDQIKRLCDRYGVKTLFVFGSATSDKFNRQSDIDLIVDIINEDPIIYSENYFALKFQLEQLFKRQIDLLEQRAIKNPYLKTQIDQTKVLVYGK